MKLIERSTDRLVLRMGVPYVNGTTCDLNRETGRATIKTITFFWPRTVAVALKDIIAVETFNQRHDVGEGGSVVAALPIVTFSSGGTCKFTTHLYDKSGPEAVTAMKTFLGL